MDIDKLWCTTAYDVILKQGFTWLENIRPKDHEGIWEIFYSMNTKKKVTKLMAVMITFSTTLNSGFGRRAENKQKFQ